MPHGSHGRACAFNAAAFSLSLWDQAVFALLSCSAGISTSLEIKPSKVSWSSYLSRSTFLGSSSCVHVFIAVILPYSSIIQHLHVYTSESQVKFSRSSCLCTARTVLVDPFCTVRNRSCNLKCPGLCREVSSLRPWISSQRTPASALQQ